MVRVQAVNEEGSFASLSESARSPAFHLGALYVPGSGTMVPGLMSGGHYG